MEVCDIVQETGIKNIPKEKKCKKVKWLSGEALQIAVKKREEVQTVQAAKTRPEADSGSDHELLIAKFRLKLKKVGETTRPFRYDLNQSLTIIQ